MSKVRMKTLCAVLSLGLVVSACGDDDESATTAGTDSSAVGDTAADGAGLPALKVAYLVPDISGAGAVFGDDIETRDDGAARIAREFEALIDGVNASRGVNGRTIEARAFTYSLEDLTDETALVQGCVEITEDFGADYVIDTYVMALPAVQQCFADHETVLFTIGGALTEDRINELAPYVVTSSPTLDRVVSSLVPHLEEVGYLDGATVGVFLDDSAVLDGLYDDVVGPALEEAVRGPVEVVRAGIADQAAVSNAVLQFKDAGVTHVIFFGGIHQLFAFTGGAQAQSFNPRYALTDYFGGATAAAGGLDPTLLADAVGVSSCDFYTCVTESADRLSTDVETPYDMDGVSDGFRRCIDELSEARGTDYTRPAEAGASDSVTFVCEYFFLWLDAARESDIQLEPVHFVEGLQAMGDYASPRTRAVDFSDGRLAGATDFAAGIFDATCRCYVRATEWAPAE